MDKTTTKIMFSHKSDEFETPKDFYEKINNIWDFTLDPAATIDNAKCKKYYTIDDDGLSKSWEGESVFLNPPYSQNSIWVQKAYEEGQKEDTEVVVLIPARTCTKYWHNYCMKAQELHFIKGRLKFGNMTNSAPFPSVLVVFSNVKHSPLIYTMEK